MEPEIEIENPPVYVRPKKKDRISYFVAGSDSWREAVIISLISGYGNNWFNIQHTDDESKCSVELSENSLWKFQEDERNEYFRWRWHHIDPGI